MPVDGPYAYSKNWIGLDADTRPTVPKGSKYFVSDTGLWEIYTGAGWKVMPEKHSPAVNDFSTDSDCLAVYNLDSDDGGTLGSVLYQDSKNSHTLQVAYSGCTSDDTTYKVGDGSVFCNNVGTLQCPATSQDVNWPGSQLGDKDKFLVSYCYWVKFEHLADDLNQHYKGCVSKFVNAAMQFWASSGHGSTNKPEIRMGYGAGWSYDTSTPYATPVVDDRWYHFQIAMNGTTGDYWFRIWDDTAGEYIDGDGAGNPVSGTFTNTPYIVLSSVIDAPFRIGSGVGTYRHRGNIDEVVIWNVIKTPNDFDKVKKGTYKG